MPMPSRMLIVALLTLAAAASVMPLPQRPYAPALYSRANLLQDDGDAIVERADTNPPPSSTSSSSSLLRKRTAGQSCKRDNDACESHLFCSTVDFSCKEKRGLHASCRTSAGCAEQLECLNFACQPAATKSAPFDPVHDALERWFWPSPSGFPWDKRELSERSPDMEERWFWPSPSGFPWNKRELRERSPDMEERWFWPSPSGFPWDKRELSERNSDTKAEV